MTVTKEQTAELLEAAKPLIKWINDNCHPHVTVIVDNVDVVLVESICKTGTQQFLKD